MKTGKLGVTGKSERQKGNLFGKWAWQVVLQKLLGFLSNPVKPKFSNSTLDVFKRNLCEELSSPIEEKAFLVDKCRSINSVIYHQRLHDEKKNTSE